VTDPESDFIYSFRINRWSGETTYRRDRDALHWLDARQEGRVVYTAVRTVQVYKVRYFGSRATYWRGVDVVFFGRICKATPILARFARRFDCPIYGYRMVRLPGGKFGFDITDPIAAPRDAAGKIDVAATTQVITGIVENRVREHPEQWLWLQRRWR
jgi:lauroyl/myristoyl acyltransferase